MNLVTIENELIRLFNERKEAVKNHENFMSQNMKEIEELKRQKEMCLKGIDLNKIKIAESLLRVKGLSYGQYNDRCVTEAIKDIAQGAPKMSEGYFGVKNYAHWTHQESDHPYGYGPRHGSIVFSVGLKNPKEKLTEEQKECCLYYLNLLRNREMREAIVKKDMMD
ncbi:hypothetical protein [Effusibacillus dendaii]|uniref:Uncharacterized protein n=1 Tax=Effusibacillus dendaii TaxID=2743772 RepID=A0A7I8D8N3_9BACL|nr:hypothetical protein [Effusibacillus dendaii]BCJ86484.1 hypothetical protein skT53_14690 [Effusibacillus dendaii]